MAGSFNQAIIIGNLTRDPELRTTPGGQSVASFSLATNRTWTDPSGERKEASEFHEIVVWGKLGELANQYLKKGRKAMVVGRLQTRSWETDGVKRQRTEIVATDLQFLDRGDSMGAGAAPVAGTQTPAKSNDVVIEDLDDDKVNLDEIPF